MSPLEMIDEKDSLGRKMPKNDATVNIYILRSKCLRGLWESKSFFTSVRGVQGTMGGSVNGKFLIYYILLMMFQKLEVKKIVWLRNIIMEIFIHENFLDELKFGPCPRFNCSDLGFLVSDKILPASL